ncbi:MAG TPA: hypothetical protein VFT91_01820 [Dehalococcoidia bacterium]|nr:hypothetical protein [Dehalococcoidia bacterium]
MPDTDGRSDVMQLWRSWLTETERQWNGFFNEMMGTDAFGRLAGSYLEAYSGVQRLLNQSMERYLNTFNLPTRSDLVELGERLRAVEERLTSLESTLAGMAEAAGLQASPAAVTRLRPRRTRRPSQSGNNA